MRVLRLILLGLLAYVVSVSVSVSGSAVSRTYQARYPAGPISRRGRQACTAARWRSVTYDDGLIPLDFQDVTWKLAPGALLKGGAGANVTFAGYGGGGDAQVRRQWNGDINVSDANFDVESKELEALLPAPITEFSGRIKGHFEKIALANQLLETMVGQLRWNDAVIVTRLYGPELTANLGQFDVVIEPDADATHKVTMVSQGGDLAIDGSVLISANGDYRTNMLLTPSANASQELQQVLQRLTRPDGGGRYRIQHSGNINQGT